MSALEREILEKFQQLDPDAQRRIIQTISATRPEAEDQPDPWGSWLRTTQALRAELQQKYGPSTGIDVTALVREAREED
ncbi:MAG: hypothetical protein KME04_13280 [Pleurocapsa minor GSE-CHR-MK-17-07R]|jgi:hypothetical protein|nr:hypothetical protein [Pleurocapsa minor GSE-CHR-MK 17-07R]